MVRKRKPDWHYFKFGDYAGSSGVLRIFLIIRAK